MTHKTYSVEEEVEALTSAIESSCVDIAPDYSSWLDLAFALSDALGEVGRSYFHRLSRFYPSYDEREVDKQFTACLNSHGSGITIKTLFHLAKQAGILSPQSPFSPNCLTLKKVDSQKSQICTNYTQRNRSCTSTK